MARSSAHASSCTANSTGPKRRGAPDGTAVHTPGEIRAPADPHVPLFEVSSRTMSWPASNFGASRAPRSRTRLAEQDGALRWIAAHADLVAADWLCRELAGLPPDGRRGCRGRGRAVRVRRGNERRGVCIAPVSGKAPSGSNAPTSSRRLCGQRLAAREADRGLPRSGHGVHAARRAAHLHRRLAHRDRVQRDRHRRDGGRLRTPRRAPAAGRRPAPRRPAASARTAAPPIMPMASLGAPPYPPGDRGRGSVPTVSPCGVPSSGRGPAVSRGHGGRSAEAARRRARTFPPPPPPPRSRITSSTMTYRRGALRCRR